MNFSKYKLLFFGLSLFFFVTGLVQTSLSQAIDNLALSKDRISTVCPMRIAVDTTCSEEQAKIKVSVTLKGESSNAKHFIYVVSGGEIQGVGSNVVWDLSSAPPGRHSITVGIGEKMIIKGKTVTKQVVIVGCPVCDLPCECPTIEVSRPEIAVTPGDAFVVQANVRGGGVKSPSYKWTVSEGTIEAGDKSSQILVRTDRKTRSKNLEVKVVVDGSDAACNCPKNFSITVDLKP